MNVKVCWRSGPFGRGYFSSTAGSEVEEHLQTFDSFTNISASLARTLSSSFFSRSSTNFLRFWFSSDAFVAAASISFCNFSFADFNFLFSFWRTSLVILKELMVSSCCIIRFLWRSRALWAEIRFIIFLCCAFCSMERWSNLALFLGLGFSSLPFPLSPEILLPGDVTTSMTWSSVSNVMSPILHKSTISILMSFSSVEEDVEEFSSKESRIGTRVSFRLLTCCMYNIFFKKNFRYYFPDTFLSWTAVCCRMYCTQQLEEEHSDRWWDCGWSDGFKY